MGNERDERLISLFTPMAAAVAAAAPGGWEGATLRAYAGPFRGDAEVVYRLPGGIKDAEREVDLNDEVGTLVQLAKGPGAGLEVMLDVAASGAYEAVVTPRSKRKTYAGGGGYICDFDEGPPPKKARKKKDDEKPIDGSQAGDPDEAVRLLEEMRRRLGEIRGPEAAEPAPPASPERLDALEKRVRRRLPADLRALYERAGHDPRLFYWEWLTVGELLGPESHLGVRSPSGSDPARSLDADPPHTVRRVTGHPGWIPFAWDGSGNYLAVDMAPARNGRPGQVIAAGRDYGSGPGYVADSVTSLLRRQLEWLDAGEYEAGEDGSFEFNGDLWHAGMRGARDKHVLSAAALADAVTPRLQHLTVLCDEPLDLSPLAGAPMLEYLKVRCRGPLDLSPLGGLPIEELDVTATSVDLTGLTASPTLRALNVTAERPVEIACLRTLPHLRHLGLAHALATDLEALAGLPSLRALHLSPDQRDGLEVLTDLPGVRALSLSPGQWRELRRRTGAFPSLSTAGLVGDATYAEAARWADLFPSIPAPPLLRHSGSLLKKQG